MECLNSETKVSELAYFCLWYEYGIGDTNKDPPRECGGAGLLVG